MFMNKARKSDLLQKLEGLQSLLAEYNTLSKEVKETYGIDLFDEIQNNLLEYRGFEDDYMESINRTIHSIEGVMSDLTVDTQAYLKLLMKISSHTQNLREFIFHTERVKPTFDFKATVENIESNIRKVIDYAEDFIVPESVTESGHKFIDIYRNKVVINCRTDLALMGLCDTRDYDNILYAKLVGLYFNLQDADDHSHDIFASYSGKSPQKFLVSPIEPSHVKANLEYFAEHFKTVKLMDEGTYEEALGEYNLSNMTDLARTIFERWKATEPKNFGETYYEYIPPVSGNFTELIRHSKDIWENESQETIERKFLLGMKKFDYIGSWVLLWKYAKAKGVPEIMEICEQSLVERIDKPSSRKLSYDNYAKFNEVIAQHVFN